jgi:hypothetical protein
MEGEERRPSNRPSQMAEEGWSCTSEQRRAIMTATQMLDLGTLDKESFRLLEQLTSRIQHQPLAAALGSESSLGAVQQPALPEGAQTESESSGGSGLEPSPGDPSNESMDTGVVVGSLRAAPEDK